MIELCLYAEEKLKSGQPPLDKRLAISAGMGRVSLTKADLAGPVSMAFDYHEHFMSYVFMLLAMKDAIIGDRTSVSQADLQAALTERLAMRPAGAPRAAQM